jgi:integrase
LPNKKSIGRKRKEDVENAVIEYFLEEEKNHEVITLVSIYDQFMKSRIGLSPHTLAKQIRYWNEYYKDSDLAQIPLKSISRQDIRDFFTALLNAHPMTYSNFKNVKGLLNLMLDYALEKEFIDLNKMTGMKFNKKPFRSLYLSPAQHKDNEDALSPEEVQQLIKEAENDFNDRGLPSALGIPIALLTGMRISELSALRFSDFDRSKGKLTLSRMMVAACNEEDITKYNGYVIVNGLKADHPFRTLDVDDMVFYYLDLIRAKNAELGYPTDEDNHIFWRNNHNTKHQTEMCTPRTFDSLMRTYCRHCGFNYIYSLHDLRRTYVTTLAENDVPLSDIQHQVGHTTVEMTLKYLRQRQEENERKRILNNAFRQLKRNDKPEVTKSDMK